MSGTSICMHRSHGAGWICCLNEGSCCCRCTPGGQRMCLAHPAVSISSLKVATGTEHSLAFCFQRLIMQLGTAGRAENDFNLSAESYWPGGPRAAGAPPCKFPQCRQRGFLASFIFSGVTEWTHITEEGTKSHRFQGTGRRVPPFIQRKISRIGAPTIVFSSQEDGTQLYIGDTTAISCMDLPFLSTVLHCLHLLQALCASRQGQDCVGGSMCQRCSAVWLWRSCRLSWWAVYRER